MSNKTLAVTTKEKAYAILRSIPGACRLPYCTGRYTWRGSEQAFVGQAIESVSEAVKAIYVEHRSDDGGPYAEMMCITVNKSQQTLQVTTRSNASAILRQTPGARRFPYCTGKYSWSGTAKDYIGQPIENVGDNVKAIYVERRTDAHGPYAKMMCITV
ncbi:DUF987 family protein [Marinimicrobium sp. ABcell2]|uniref:DUF987 family protein n=1 Tax=Marinimicrobium sp. ABcell2 TaxID=3069751 RepID=UPI0027B7B589|nr:DUF987 family protein [Marinimicrobium sp. ABcell2]MDQ2077447.1 DUF987 family protein [Marinimicrobium sp. ABcell2]